MYGQEGKEDYDYAEDDDFEEEDDDSGNSQFYYCEVCKVSCSGIQPYNSHLDGKKHKRKEEMMQNEGQSESIGVVEFRCETCNVMCSGDANYQSHLKGAKHLKAVRLLETMGILPKKAKILEAQNSALIDVRSASENFIPPSDQDVELVGREFVEELDDESSSVQTYTCKLCECSCTNKEGMEDHIRGRRHRLQYKKKVCPDLDVDTKPVPKTKRGSEEKYRKDLMRLRQQELWNMRAMYQSTLMPKKPECVEKAASGPMAMFGMRVAAEEVKRESLDDRFLKAKEATLYPSKDEVTAFTRAISNVETVLKRVSDRIIKEQKTMGTFRSDSTTSNGRNLQGVIRVGALGNSVMLRGERIGHLVVMCEQKPTEFLMRQICEYMRKEIEIDIKEKYDVWWDAEWCVIKVSSSGEAGVMVVISFTSISMRETDLAASNKSDPPDVLNYDRCIEALATLRHTKWFQARCLDLEHCSVILRIMRDICRRVDTWTPLNPWALELLVEKVLCTSGASLTLGEAFRRVFEAVASGIFLPDSLGLLDPCEKDVVDAAWDLTPQQREDLTASAQKALRLIAFKKIYCVLAVGPYIEELEEHLGIFRQRKRLRNE